MSNATNLSHIDSSDSNTLVEAALPLPCVLIYIRLDDKLFMKVSELWAMEGPPQTKALILLSLDFDLLLNSSWRTLNVYFMDVQCDQP